VNICVIHKDGSVTHLTDQPISDYPVWSPDSSTLAYQTHRGSGNLGFAFERLSGSGAEAVFKSDVNPLAWHPDGKHLLMVGDDRASIFDVNGREQRKFPVNASVSYNAQFSPDGKWLAYVSDETGKPEVYAASFPSGEGVVQISKGGGMAPHWRRDGRELYYLGPAKTIFAVGADVNHGIVKLSSSRPLFSVPSIPVQWAAFSFDVAADGEKFLVNTNLPGSRSDLVLITNWSR
jgi:Tol biopolymer transport system component